MIMEIPMLESGNMEERRVKVFIPFLMETPTMENFIQINFKEKVFSLFPMVVRKKGSGKMMK